MAFKDPEKKRQYEREYRARHLEEMRVKDQKRIRDRLSYQKEYREEHEEILREQSAKRMKKMREKGKSNAL